ncbi:MAG: carbohydrate-binding protein [Anaerolineae bacterium]|nr:carbohydrate-binding protein [Phycisphaerae bacterium]
MFGLQFLNRSNRPVVHAAGRKRGPCIIEPLEDRALFSGNGLSGAYFNNIDLTAKALARTDGQISFDWSAGAPAAGVGADYGVRWSGRVQARFTEQYRFVTFTAGGVRLWIDNKLIVDNWTSHALTANSGYINLTAGKRYNVQLEYQHTSGPATAKLYWESARQPKQIVPRAYLYSSDVDSVAPAGLSNVHASYVTDKTIRMDWNAASDPSLTVYYDVYNGKTKIGTTSSTTWTRAGRTAGTAYNWTIVAVDPSGNASAGKSTTVTTLSAPAASGGLGLAAKYYGGSNFGQFISTRTDGSINFSWASAPVATSDDAFSVRWEGSIVPFYTETYTLYFTSDDGVQLWIDNKLVINHAVDHAAAEDRAAVALTAGRKHSIRVDYHNSAGTGVAKLEWASLSQPRQVVPASQLLPAFTDNSAPTTPTNLHTTTVGSSAVTMTWNASTDDVGVFGYDVYRGSTKIATVQAPEFTDDGLSAGTQYQYKVIALDGAARKSGTSSTLNVTTSTATIRDALNPIGATTYDSASGVIKSGNNVLGLGNNDWMQYDNVNFHGGVNSVRITLALATTNVGGSIELRLDSKTGPVIGTMVVQPTGSFVTYFTQKTEISGASGTHSLFLVGKNVSNIANVQKIQFSTQELIRIMPLGDSITQSFGNFNSYRYYLWQKLEDAGYGVDFVGSQTKAAGDQFPADFDFDQDHEGHSGFTTADIKAQIANWALSAQPDVVLIHLGTNDMRFGMGTNTAINNIEDIIDILRSVNPNVKIVLAKLIPAGDAAPGAIENFNDRIPSLVNLMNTVQSRIIMVDQYTGFNLELDSDDALHPNDLGDRLMADRWYAQLAPLLG